jgi:type II secretory pathway pseudopilin PulG
VVIAVLALLAALSFPVMGSIQRRAKAGATDNLIEKIALALASYESDFGDYPPTSLKAFGIRNNGVNEGSESLLRCLTTQSKQGPYLDFAESDLVNTDGDEVSDSVTGTIIAVETAFEIGDAFGNPLVYFHSRDYENARLGRYQSLGGERIVAAPARSDVTGQFHGFGKFQLWSVGADGQSQDGAAGSDDVVGWD